jgi:outer membrane protein OmpA-like peptidoglycan-associated protein
MKLKSAYLPVLLALLIIPSFAQSHDPSHPTPLAPGTNKGNVDNIQGPHFYYFYAGPGRIDIRMVFHEMGVFGNPLRQSLNFDLGDANGKVFEHESLISQGNTVTLTNHGTIDKRGKILVAVTAQKGTIRLGGYYEFEVTGVAFFDGKGGSSSATGPIDTHLTTTAKNGPVALTQGQTALTNGPVDLTPGTKNGPVALTSGKPVTLVYPGQALTVHETPHELRITLAADVLFDFNKSDIRPGAIPTLRDAAAKIKAARPHNPVLVAGYTDAKGSDALNLKLSQQRAAAVELWLIQNAGFAVSNFTPKGYGATHPVAPNQKPNGQDNPAGRQLNRRVELVVTK